jgi:chorismate mutase
VLEALKNKNPQVRENSARFLVRALKTTRDAPTPEQTKEMAEPAKKLLAESAPGLRETGAEILGVLWKIMGDRNMLAHLEGLTDIHKNKVKEASEAAEVKAKWKPKAAPPPKAAAPPAKKPAAGSKRPAVKKPAPKPKPASPPLDEDPPAMAPRPTSRPAAKPAGVRPPGGLKAPGAGLKPPGSGLASPSKRQGVVVEDFPPAAPKAAPGRGLAGRPLGKPATAPSSPPPTPRHEGPSSALSSIERQELYDLRSEIDLVRQQCSDLRTDKMRLGSQISELQNQNAQLIEDHTRDVLQVKAKETQLVRARSDHETAEDRANGLSREIDRLKREITRLSRSQGGRDSPVDMSSGGHGMLGNGSTPRPAYGSSRSSYNMPPPRTYSGENHHYGGDGKENMPDYEHGYENSGKQPSSGLSGRPVSNASSGRATPNGDEHGRPASNSTNYNNNGASHSSMSRNPSAGGDGVESWKRAAEVTQNLKARIEMMKVRPRSFMTSSKHDN